MEWSEADVGVVVKTESLVLDKSKMRGNVKLAEENGGSREYVICIWYLKPLDWMMQPQ